MLNAEWSPTITLYAGKVKRYLSAFVLFSPICRTFRRLQQLFQKVSNHDKEIIEVYT